MDFVSLISQLRIFFIKEIDPPILKLNLESKVPATAPVARSVAYTREHERFLEVADTRVKSTGVLLEDGHATLFRVESYRCDELGVWIRITHVLRPGFRTPRLDTCEIGAAWDYFVANQERWQARHCWKFLFGEDQINTVIAVGAEEAARGRLLSDSQVFAVFRWHALSDAKKNELFGTANLASLVESLLKMPPPPRIPLARPIKREGED